MNDGTDYRAILASDTPLIDVRAPIEFAQGAMPAAINLPLMNDDERAAVGTCYKRQGPEAALALGHQLVSGETREARINAWREASSPHMAATGALASGAMSGVLAGSGTVSCGATDFCTGLGKEGSGMTCLEHPQKKESAIKIQTEITNLSCQIYL